MNSRFSFEAIGTKWHVDIDEDIPEERKADLEKAIMDRVKQFDAVYSRFKEDSWLNTVSHTAGTYELPEDGESLFSLYQDLYRITQGLVTPLIGQALEDAGYDKEYSFDQKRPLTAPPLWDEIIELSLSSDLHLAPHRIIIKKPAQFDLGAVGKGCIIDIVAGLLETSGVISYCVDAGGDMRHRSHAGKPYRVGLEHPEDTSKVIGVMSLENMSIAGSSGNRRKWKKFNHIIDPRTLSSPQNILAVWVVAKTAMLADAMTTSLYFTPAETLLGRYSFDYLIVYSDRSAEGSLLRSPMLELY